MKTSLHFLIFLLSVSIVSQASANRISEKKLYGRWCFYTQEYQGESVAERVSIIFREDGSYTWRDRGYKQSGHWRVADDYLIMSGVGRHRLISISSNRVTMERFTTMKMRKGGC